MIGLVGKLGRWYQLAISCYRRIVDVLSEASWVLRKRTYGNRCAIQKLWRYIRTILCFTEEEAEAQKKVFVSYTDCSTVVIVFLGRLAHTQMWYSCNWLVSRLICDRITMQRSEVSKALRVMDWINCGLCNGWVHIKCANLSRTKARSIAKFKCSRCFLVNTITQCQDDNFRTDTLFNSGVVHLKRIPKSSQIPLAENLTPKINDICETSSNIALWGAYCSHL